MCRCGEMFIFAEMAMPDEACSVSLFKHNMKSFTINIYGEPKRHPLCNLPDPPNSQSTSVQKQPLNTTNRLVMCQSLCLCHLKEKIKINNLKPVLTRFHYASNCAGNFFWNQQLTSIDLLSDKDLESGSRLSENCFVMLVECCQTEFNQELF